MTEPTADADELEALLRKCATLREGLRESLESELRAKAGADDARAELRAYRAALFNFSGAAIESEIHARALAWLAGAVPWPTFADADPPDLDADGWQNSE